MNRTSLLASSLSAILVLSACAGQPSRPGTAPFLASELLATRHADADDLLTAGLGAAGLRSPAPPAFADPQSPTASELRRRAIWTNWRGIADLAPGGGFGELYGSLAPVPGREFQAFAKLPGASQPHRVLVQLPDAFDTGKRCVVVTASSGSRGIYGAIALAGSWGLSHGCAVAYTDKGAGTGYVDIGSGSGVSLDGTRIAAGGVMEFSAPAAADAPARIAVKHAHSGDNPEADWGRHVQQAAQFALQVLDSAHPDAAPFNAGNTRVIALGVSNGGGAVLRAAELPGDWFDGVVAVAPNVYPAEGGRALFDYVTEAALLMPCALNATVFDGVALARPGGSKSPAGSVRCASLHDLGQLRAATAALQAEEALGLLHAGNWTDAAIAAGAISTSFDLWRAVAVTYASAYARTPTQAMPCGYAFQATDAKGVPQAPGAAMQAAWWSDSAGIPPGHGVGIHDGMASAGVDPALPGLQCLRGLWKDAGPVSDRVRAGVAATRAGPPRAGLPVIVIHGADDGLVPEAFSGGAYAASNRAAGRDLRYWRVGNAQHFDAFLGLPVLGANYVPMLPYAYRALDRMWAHLESGAALPGNAEIATRKRALGPAGLAPLSAEDLALP